jgi:hypothetical protein
MILNPIDYTGDPRAVLCHFNKNHDPNTGRFTSGKVKGLATTVYNQAAKRVDKVENDVRTAAEKTGAKMYGLKHRQKTLESIARKIETDAHEKGISYEQAASDIKDAIRFTTVSSDDDFVRNYREFKYHLAMRGYEELRCKNYFDLYNKGEAKHKQVTSVFGEPGGYRFEVQFQTPSSLDAKEKKTVLYEEVRKEGVSEQRRAEIVREMEKLAETVPTPKDINEIKNH